MGITLDGLSSGLDTTALINSLLQVEAIPQTQMKTKSAGIQSFISALQGLNTKVAALATQATALAKPDAMSPLAVSTGSDKVTAIVSAGASAGTIDFSVTKLAQTQVSVSGPLTAWPDSSLTITAGGKSVTVTPETTSLEDVVRAVNAADSGVRATKIAVGDGQYRLQLTAATSGAAASFAVSGTAATFSTAKAAQDAELTLWAGSAAEQSITSATNTFADLLPGVAVTLNGIPTAPVTMAVARDDAKATKSASDLVAGVNDILTLISSRSAVNTSGTSVSGGIFTGESSVREVNQRILSAASMPLGTPPRSPSEIGISITRSGTMEFDEKKFSAAMAADPLGVGARVQELAARIATAATAASDKYDGSLTTAITGQQSQVKDLGQRILDWDLRLASRKESLQRTYTALEVAMSNMNSQSSWLSSQVAGLSSGSSS
ncbi:flagellar filament capping protein FliD [Pseudarthrobacter sp. PS3-L1]|uniref:flagellar filament capping protein FliD n=1 Tax=Pseudarthrobacter sp. PS3-L1 TaxID=3046207 RepID=UPI0024B99733|nr:flagellar filament capping protein FliD [Pseudarthrobacter sp. PS3-L1]MDJ0319323.1 flagellar filament capping protein FliD [Pseudarthrobacter sp. PS3-L1]